MKLRAKFATFLISIILTFIGFNMIASPLVCVVEVGKEARYEIITNYLAEADSASNHSCPISSIGTSR